MRFLPKGLFPKFSAIQNAPRVAKTSAICLSIFLGLSFVQASAGSTTADIQACINKNTGSVRISQICSPRETPFQWLINGLTGKEGPRGAQILTAKDLQTLTAKEFGLVGDYVITSADSTLYGPKSESGWPKVGVKLQGPIGAAGPAGTAGANGAAGAAGSNGTNGTNGTNGSSATLTCAQGGTCALGDTGPGGGKVFYILTAPAAAPWRYLEAAPNTWSGGSADPTIKWCSVTNAFVKNLVDGTTSATGTAIGNGFANTRAMLGSCAYGAANAAEAYNGGGKSDWFLPSKDELNQLYSNRSSVGGFETGFYWSSSENGDNYAWVQFFNSGGQSSGTKSSVYYVRPVRAF